MQSIKIIVGNLQLFKCGKKMEKNLKNRKKWKNVIINIYKI